MTDLSVNYMGIKLKNPIIVGACNLVTEIDNLKRMEEAGAAAIVYKSLFEEQIQLESLQMSEEMEEFTERNAEMISMFPDVEHAGPTEYLMELKKARDSVSIPMFASLNAIEMETWEEYAKKIEEVGVAGIELNLYYVPSDFEIMGKAIVSEQLDILSAVRKAVKIPIAVKLSPYYTNPLYVIKEMDKLGVNAFVLFNRLFQPEIDIDREELHFPYNLSNSDDNRFPLRVAGMLYNNINANICSSRGVFTGEDVVAMILAGADCVQVVSTLYRNKIEQISAILTDIERWMNNKGYKKLEDFRGKMSRKNIQDPFAYRRAQYVDILMKSEQIFKKYPTI
ncbi:MAG: dihydroorotate dehydrogenase-like protein [Bacteroidales bacterium]|nr:dihydroorotate dehydrogenase-like protein [Bacteroidales bacterium]